MAIDESSIPFPLAPTTPGHASIDAAKRHRQALFRESPLAVARRWFWGTAHALAPQRIGDLPYLVFHCAVDLLGGGTAIPHTSHTRARPDTFGGVCKDMSWETVLEAARRGFFPWCRVGPLKWWTRKERMVLFFDRHRISEHLRDEMRAAKYRVTFDTAFERVISACASPESDNARAPGWITPRVMHLYANLFDRGHAHSFEVWNETGELVGGGYGVAVGRIFITESRFGHEPGASKMGFAVLNHHLAKWGYVLNDGKDFTPELEAMGFHLISRAGYERQLTLHATPKERSGKFISREQYEALLKAQETTRTRTGRWTVEATLSEVADWAPEERTETAAKESKSKAAPAKTAAPA